MEFLKHSFPVGFALKVVWDNGGRAAGAHADGALAPRAVRRFLPERQSRRQRVVRQPLEDLGHRDRSPGEQICGSAWRVARWRGYFRAFPAGFGKFLSEMVEILPGLCQSGFQGSLRPDRGVTEGCFCTKFYKCVFEKRARAINSTRAFP